MKIDRIFLGFLALGTLASIVFVVLPPNPERGKMQAFEVVSPELQKPANDLHITLTGEWKAAFQPLPIGSSHETQRIFRDLIPGLDWLIRHFKDARGG